MLEWGPCTTGCSDLTTDFPQLSARWFLQSSLSHGQKSSFNSLVPELAQAIKRLVCNRTTAPLLFLSRTDFSFQSPCCCRKKKNWGQGMASGIQTLKETFFISSKSLDFSSSVLSALHTELLQQVKICCAFTPTKRLGLREATCDRNCQNNFSKRGNSHKSNWDPQKEHSRVSELLHSAHGVCKKWLAQTNWTKYVEVTTLPSAGKRKVYKNEWGNPQFAGAAVLWQAGRAQRGSWCRGWSSTTRAAGVFTPRETLPMRHSECRAGHLRLPENRVEMVSPAEII